MLLYCKIMDTPSHLVLQVLFPVIRFIDGTPPGFLRSIFPQSVQLLEIPHSSRYAGSIRNDISFCKERGKKWRFATQVNTPKEFFCESPLLPPNSQLLAVSFRASTRNLLLPFLYSIPCLLERWSKAEGNLPDQGLNLLFQVLSLGPSFLTLSVPIAIGICG